MAWAWAWACLGYVCNSCLLWACQPPGVTQSLCLVPLSAVGVRYPARAQHPCWQLLVFLTLRLHAPPPASSLLRLGNVRSSCGPCKALAGRAKHTSRRPCKASWRAPCQPPPHSPTPLRQVELHGIFLSRSGRRNKRLEEYLDSIKVPNRYGYHPIGLEWDLW